MFTKNYSLTRKFGFILMLLSLFSVSTDVFAEQQEPNEQADLFEMSIEDLMEVPVVISASRQPQKFSELSVPVSVITAEDIHYSGLTNIAEILQFTPGIDLFWVDRNRPAVGVRGMHDVYSDRILSLVDGRPADNLVWGGPEFFRLPILMEDIKRIEVVRGPGGAAWGANAFTGVINIITKEPEDCLGLLTSTTWNHFGDTYSYLRWAEKADKWSWRISLGYEDRESSKDAIDASYRNSEPSLNSLIGFDQYVARDFQRNYRLDTKAVYRAYDSTKLSFGVGTSQMESSDAEIVAYHPMQNAHTRTTRLFAKVDHEFHNGATGHFLWFGNFGQTDVTADTRRTTENGVEGQYNFKLGEDHSVSVGASAKWVHINTSSPDPEDLRWIGEPFNEEWFGLFVIDRWQATDRLAFEGQLRGDRYSGTGKDWAGRLSAFYALDENKRHVLRFSTAKAFRTPLSILRKVETNRVSVGGGLYYFNVMQPRDDLENEETWSLEAGYTGKLKKWMTFRANGYFQRFRKLIGYRSDYVIVPGLQYRYPDNIDGANASGVELELELKSKIGKLSIWYAYSDLEEDPGNGELDMRAFPPVLRKFGLTGRLFLSDGWTLNANYRNSLVTPVTASSLVGTNPTRSFSADSVDRLDITVSKEFAAGNGELMFGVSDVLEKEHDGTSGLFAFTAHETPGQTFFVRLQLKF